MKRRWSVPVAAALSVLVLTSAAAQDTCTPIEPKKWEGSIAYGGGGWIGTTVFERSGCTWNGTERLNGSDTIVWDVTGYGGVTATLTHSSADGLHHELEGFFFDEHCERGDAWGVTEPDTPFAIGIPDGAKWIVIYQSYGGVETSVTLETPGRACDPVATPKPPKKTSKPKRP